MEESPSPAQEPVFLAEAVTPQELVISESAVTSEPSVYLTIVHLTRAWVNAGIFGFAVLCIVIGALEAMFGR